MLLPDEAKAGLIGLGGLVEVFLLIRRQHVVFRRLALLLFWLLGLCGCLRGAGTLRTQSGQECSGGKALRHITKALRHILRVPAASPLGCDATPTPCIEAERRMVTSALESTRRHARHIASRCRRLPKWRRWF